METLDYYQTVFLTFSWSYVFYVGLQVLMGLAKPHCGATPPSVMVLFLVVLHCYSKGVQIQEWFGGIFIFFWVVDAGGPGGCIWSVGRSSGRGGGGQVWGSPGVLSLWVPPPPSSSQSVGTGGLSPTTADNQPSERSVEAEARGKKRQTEKRRGWCRLGWEAAGFSDGRRLQSPPIPWIRWVRLGLYIHSMMIYAAAKVCIFIYKHTIGVWMETVWTKHLPKVEQTTTCWIKKGSSLKETRLCLRNSQTIQSIKDSDSDSETVSLIFLCLRGWLSNSDPTYNLACTSKGRYANKWEGSLIHFHNFFSTFTI